jgi:hypothetical protein
MNDRLVCMSVATLPTPSVPSFRDTCILCEAPVWRSNRSAGLEAEPICLDCTGAEAIHAGGDLEMVLPPYVAADLATWNNRPGEN